MADGTPLDEYLNGPGFIVAPFGDDRTAMSAKSRTGGTVLELQNYQYRWVLTAKLGTDDAVSIERAYSTNKVMPGNKAHDEIADKIDD